MKKLIAGVSVLFVLIILFIPSVFAYTGYGLCNFGKQVVNSVLCTTPTVMKDTTVNGDVKVTGSVSAKNISAKNMTITGTVDIADSEIKGFVNITGSLTADHVVFNKGVAINSDSAQLNHSSINGLVTMTSNQNTPYLQVQCSSVITGSVLFDGKAGVIQITGDSLVKGKVVNGSMEFVKRNCNG